MGRAEELFRELGSDGEKTINEWISQQRSEELFLDYKRSDGNGAGSKLRDSDWDNLAKAISGFGNSDGGVIVWGVTCKSVPNVGDVPTGTQMIENPARFVSWLQGATSGCTTPAHRGVMHLPVVSAADSTKGFAATLVPRSEPTPLQCIKPSGKLQYYMRAGSSFMPVPHAVLSGLFGRGVQPLLDLSARAMLREEGGTRTLHNLPFGFEIQLELVSRGPGVCRDAYLTVETKAPGPKSSIDVDSGTREHRWFYSQSDDHRISLITEEGHRLAPGAVQTILSMRVVIAQPLETSLQLSFTFGHRTSAVQRREIEVTPLELVARSSNLATALNVRDSGQTCPPRLLDDLADWVLGLRPHQPNPADYLPSHP